MGPVTGSIPTSVVLSCTAGAGRGDRYNIFIDDEAGDFTMEADACYFKEKVRYAV